MSSPEPSQTEYETSAPFPKEYELTSSISLIAKRQGGADERENTTLALPGHPTVPLHRGSRLYSLLEKELVCRDLETMAPHMWLFSQQTSSNISPLHRQLVKNRRIIISEDPRLHLVWIGDRIFIKPLPAYMLSFDFWRSYLRCDPRSPQQRSLVDIRAAALGLLRSYALLIRYEADFAIATRPEARLIPGEASFWQLLHLLDAVKQNVDDSQVSQRFAYGELRLSRLNFYGKFILRRRHFHRTHLQYSAYIAQFYGPVLFIVGFASIFLNAMQVEISVEDVAAGRLGAFWSFCRWFSISVIALGGMFSFVVLGMLSYIFGKEWTYAIRDRIQKKKDGVSSTVVNYA
jgi:hypothetical protein